MKRKKWEMPAVVALFLSVTIGIFAPLEMYLTNQSEIWFALSDLIGVVMIGAVAIFCFVFIIGIMMKIGGVLYKNYIATIFAGALLVYLQGNFFNLDLGVMNGQAVDWYSFLDEFVVNLLLWLVIFAVIIYFANKKWRITQNIIKYTSLMLSLMQIFTIIVLLVTTPQAEGEGKKKYFTDKDMLHVSEEENVIVFLMDMYDHTYFEKLIENEPQLLEELDGFTYFANSVGSHNTTSYSLAMLMTGRYLYNEEPFHVQLNTAFQQSDMIPRLAENGFLIDAYTPGFIPGDMYPYLGNYFEIDVAIGSKLQLAKSMYKLVACKYFPDGFKPIVWTDGSEFEKLKIAKEGDCDRYTSNNIDFYNKLREKGVVTEKQGKRFKFIYLDGVHYPYYHDEELNPTITNYKSYLPSARGVLRIVQEYADQLKEKGVYDNTAIVVIADHGYYDDGVLTSPLLLVKPMNARGEMRISSAPVCHRDFQPSILTLAGLNDNGQYGESYFDFQEGEDRERLYYQYNLKERAVEGNHRLTEYIVDGSDNKRENFRLTNVEYSPTGERITHKDKCQFCLSGEEVPVENEENWPVRIVHTPIE